MRHVPCGQTITHWSSHWRPGRTPVASSVVLDPQLMPNWTKSFMSVCVSLIHKVRNVYLKQSEGLNHFGVASLRKPDRTDFDRMLKKIQLRGLNLSSSMTSVSKISWPLCKHCWKQSPEDGIFWLEEEGGKNYLGVLMSLANSGRNCELWKGNWARK